jgi:bacterioferritin B
MSALVAVVRRSKDNIEAIEEYIQREQRTNSSDPTAPAIAGG